MPYTQRPKAAERDESAERMIIRTNHVPNADRHLKQILIFCKRDKKDISFQDNYVYLQAEQENEKCQNRSKWNKTALSY